MRVSRSISLKKSVNFVGKHSFATLSYMSNPQKSVESSVSTGASSNVAHQAGTVQDPRYYEKFTFEKDFLVDKSSMKSMYRVPEGGFVVADMNELNKYIPEGLSGPVQDALNMKSVDSESVWMVREGGKLLCKVIDEHNANMSVSDKKTKEVDAEVVSKRHIHIPSLTDRNEWSDNVLKVTHYGKDLVNFEMEQLQGATKYVQLVKKDECAVEKCISSLKQEKKLPDKILLTGERGCGKSFILTQAVLHARKADWLVVYIPSGWEQTCEGSYVEPPLVPLPEQSVSNGDMDILTSMSTITKPSVHNPLYQQMLDNEANPQVFDNIFQSASALRSLHRAHAKELRAIPITYSNSNDNSVHYRKLYNQKNNIMESNADVAAAVAKQTERYSSVDALEMLRGLFLQSAEKILSAPGRSNMKFQQLRQFVEGEDNFPDQDALDADILKDFSMQDFEFKTLEDLVLFGLAVRGAAGSVFMHVIEELKLNVNNNKIMFAVDQYNTFEAPSAYSWNMRPITGKNLCVPRALYGITKKKADNDKYSIKNGIFIASTSHTHEEGVKETFYDAIKSIPLCIRVPNYSQMEYFAAMRHYAHLCRLTEFVTISQLLTYRMLCRSNPYEMRQNCFLYFTSLGMNSYLDMENYAYLAPAGLGNMQNVSQMLQIQKNNLASPENEAKPLEEMSHSEIAANNIIYFGVTEEQKRQKMAELDSKFHEFKKNFKGVQN